MTGRSLGHGVCPVCGRWLAVTTKGAMRVHPERAPERCSGSGLAAVDAANGDAS